MSKVPESAAASDDDDDDDADDVFVCSVMVMNAITTPDKIPYALCEFYGVRRVDEWILLTAEFSQARRCQLFTPQSLAFTVADILAISVGTDDG
ncbi:unnamed protein product [Angiostrongylus costaricensis]|uniref:UDENN domain-containing protein n=1 Tax=Angiostrongylus costaricensis TaxID=334426 RepID=A0A0R3PTN0_ANGCS|nr:unnamed protein product [Angiostrongylus costaricensis]